MPKVYIPQCEKKHTEENLLEAVAEVQQGHPVHKVAKQFNVPTEALRRWVIKDSNITFGDERRPVLHKSEEELIVFGLDQCAKAG